MDGPWTLREILVEILRQLDPKASLDRAANALDQGDYDTAREALDDYGAWRKRGGFEPPGGDDRARELRRRLRGRRPPKASS